MNELPKTIDQSYHQKKNLYKNMSCVSLLIGVDNFFLLFMLLIDMLHR